MTTTEGGLQCVRCGYLFSPSDRLLCRVGEIRFCPSCWSRVEVVAPQCNRDTAGAVIFSPGADGRRN